MTSDAASADYSNWVNELTTLQSTSTTLDSARSGTSLTKNMCLSARTTQQQPSSNNLAKSTIDELQQEMKLLQWHKLANEAALKAALIKTKKLKSSHTSAPLEHNNAGEERAEWMQQIIEEEQTKPMEVNSEFIREYQALELQEEVRKEAEVERHIQSLQKLKKTLHEREQLRQRQTRYREGKLALKQEQQKNDAKYSSSNNHRNIRNSNQRSPSHDIRPTTSVETIPGSTSSCSSISKVVHSLDKLVDLEQRITQLENDHRATPALFTAMGSSSSSSAANSSTPSTTDSTSIRFIKKKRDSTSRGPSKTVYSVTMGSRSRSSAKSRSTRSGTTGVVRAQKKMTFGRSSATKTPSGTASSSTFLTSVPETSRGARSRSSGQRPPRIVRVSTRRMSDQQKRHVMKLEQRQSRQHTSRRQDKVVSSWLAQKSNKKKNASQRSLASKSHVQRPRVGAASGRTTTNRHLQEFQDAKRKAEKQRSSRNTTLRTGISQATRTRGGVVNFSSSVHSNSNSVMGSASATRRPPWGARKHQKTNLPRVLPRMHQKTSSGSSSQSIIYPSSQRGKTTSAIKNTPVLPKLQLSRKPEEVSVRLGILGQRV